jgi:hypothetical protein
MAFGSFAGQSGLGDLPEVNLLFGADFSLRGNRSAIGLGGHGIDFPCSRMEIRDRLLGWKSEHAEKQ